MSDAARARYTADGALITRGLLPLHLLAAVRGELGGLLDEIEPRAGRPVGAGRDIAALSRRVAELAAEVPDAQSALYEAMSHMPSLMAIASSPRVLSVARALTSELVGVHPRRLLLMAPPEASWHVPSWHQDWYYNEGPTSTLTCYAPLQTTDVRRGGLRLALGEHHGGPLPHGDHDHGRVTKWHSLTPEATRSHTRVSEPRLEAGDVLWFHSLTPHAAHVNRGRHVRFVVNLRFRDMRDRGYADAKWHIGDITHARAALSRKPGRQ